MLLKFDSPPRRCTDATSDHARAFIPALQLAAVPSDFRHLTTPVIGYVIYHRLFSSLVRSFFFLSFFLFYFVVSLPFFLGLEEIDTIGKGKYRERVEKYAALFILFFLLIYFFLIFPRRRSISDRRRSAARIDAAKRAFRFHSRRITIQPACVSHRSYKPASNGEQPNERSRPASLSHTPTRLNLLLLRSCFGSAP